jgi:hypothetical protein
MLLLNIDIDEVSAGEVKVRRKHHRRAVNVSIIQSWAAG